MQRTRRSELRLLILQWQESRKIEKLHQTKYPLTYFSFCNVVVRDFVAVGSLARRGMPIRSDRKLFLLHFTIITRKLAALGKHTPSLLPRTILTEEGYREEVREVAKRSWRRRRHFSISVLVLFILPLLLIVFRHYSRTFNINLLASGSRFVRFVNPRVCR